MDADLPHSVSDFYLGGPVPPGWAISTSWTCHGRVVTPGRVLSVTQAKGLFRFVRHVTRADGQQWIDVVGGKPGHETVRSFRPEHVKTVHNA